MTTRRQVGGWLRSSCRHGWRLLLNGPILTHALTCLGCVLLHMYMTPVKFRQPSSWSLAVHYMRASGTWLGATCHQKLKQCKAVCQSQADSAQALGPKQRMQWLVYHAERPPICHCACVPLQVPLCAALWASSSSNHLHVTRTPT
jgi:hypothetical protein